MKNGVDGLQITDQKLRVITRRDLKSSYQGVQSAHAGIQFQHEHPEVAKQWYYKSNYLVFLTVENENELEKLVAKAKLRDITVSEFREPDIDDALTAIALEPSRLSKKITSGLPLME